MSQKSTSSNLRKSPVFWECPVPKEYREMLKEVADTVDKHKRILKKLSPF